MQCMIHERAFDSRTRTTTRLSHRTTESACKPASCWRDNFDTVVISVRGFAKMLACKVNVKDTITVLAFFDQITSNTNN